MTDLSLTPNPSVGPSTAVRVPEVRALVGFDTDAAVYRALYRGYFPAGVAYQVGRAWRFNRAKLEAWLAAGGTSEKLAKRTA
jgi:predicted DNA-binding transcriptional regulator AlpA